MKFELYTATDSRDNTRKFWLKDLNSGMVAQYHIGTSQDRIKRNSLDPDSVVRYTHATLDRCAKPFTERLFASW